MLMSCKTVNSNDGYANHRHYSTVVKLNSLCHNIQEVVKYSSMTSYKFSTVAAAYTDA